MIQENRVSKYLLYAIGEIVLVVIGILIALQLNTWNAQRMTQNNIRNYYSRIQAEVQSELKSLNMFHNKMQWLAKENRRTLEILNSQNRDSIPVLRHTLGALGTAWTVNLDFSVTKEFLNQDYLSNIKNDSIKIGLKKVSLMLVDLETASQYTITQYTNTIEPFINRHINYSEIALKRYQKDMVSGGPPTDFEALFDNLEFWNIVSFKLEGLAIDINWVERYKREMEWLDQQLLKELNSLDAE